MLTFLKWIFNSFYDVLRDVMILGGVGAAGPRSPVWIGLVLRWTLLSKQRMSSSGDTCDLINLYDFKQTKFIPVILEKSTLLSTSKKKSPTNNYKRTLFDSQPPSLLSCTLHHHQQHTLMLPHHPRHRRRCTLAWFSTHCTLHLARPAAMPTARRSRASLSSSYSTGRVIHAYRRDFFF